jgi:hypothetical protein
MTIIPATLEAKIGGSQSEVSLGKVNTRPYVKNILKAKGLRVWLKM